MRSHNRSRISGISFTVTPNERNASATALAMAAGGGVSGGASGQHGHATRERPDAVGHAVRIAGYDRHLVERHRKAVGNDLSEGGLVSLSLARRPREHEDAAVGIDADTDPLVGPEARVFDEERQAQ